MRTTRRSRRLLALPVVIAMALAGCGEDDEPVAAPTTTTTSTTTTSTTTTTEPEPVDEDPPGVTVELIEPGEEPRRELRLQPEEGTTTRARLEVTMAMEQEVDGNPVQAQPPLSMAADTNFTVASVTDEAIEVEFAYESFELTNAEDYPPEVAAQMQGTFEAMTDVTGTSRFNHRGVGLDAAFDAPEGMDPAARQSLDQIDEQIQQLTAPFPREEVGVGAQWRVTQESAVQGITTTQVSTYTLESLDGDAYVLAVDIAQDAEPQEIQMPEAPEGVTVELTEFDFSGQGRTEGSLDAVAPTSSSAQTSGTSVFRAAGGPEGGEGFERFVQEVDVEMLFETIA